MSNNKKFQPLHFIPVALVAGFLLMTSEKPVQEIKREPTSIPKVRQHPQRQMPSKPSISRGPASVPPPRYNLDRLVKPHRNVKLPRGQVLAENIGAIALSDVKPGMSIVWHDGVYAFYEKKPGERSIPVAYNPKAKKFFPIASIVHVKDVDESMRQQLKDQGHQEYVYFKNIKKLSLKTGPDQAVKLYQDLQKQGYKVKMEVIDDRPIAH